MARELELAALTKASKNMHRPSRTRHIIKWTGAGLSLLIISFWGFSTIYSVHWAVCGWDESEQMYWSGFSIYTVGHSVEVYGPGIIHRLPWKEHLIRRTSQHWSTARPAIDGWTPQLDAPGAPEPNYEWRIVIPFWLILAIIAIPTAWLWHRDRRRIRPGCCLRCAYDLTGNTSGVCSECGMPAAAAQEKSGQ